MPTSAPVALIIGSGPRVGDAVSKTLAALGYDIATTARKGTNSRTSDGFFSIKSDVSEPEAVSTVFDAVLAEFGVAPSIVIYNAASMTPPLDEGSLLSVTAQRLTNDLNVNTVSPFIAAQQAVKGWSTLPKGGGLFIYTGNAQDRTILPIPMMLTLGVGKAASSSWIGQADGFYSNNGYRFIYADERTPEGKMKGGGLDGPAHGEFYAQLAHSTKDIPWHATFVKGKGYVRFE